MKTIKQGETAPYGLFWREAGYPGKKLCLRLPVMVWHGKVYDAAWDRITRGWYRFDLFFSVRREYNQVTGSLAWGKIAMGNHKVVSDGWAAKC